METVNQIIDSSPKTEIGSIKLPSAHQIGERVELEFDGAIIKNCYVRYVIFTTGKVRYGIFLSDSSTTLHNVDSVFVQDFRNEQGQKEFSEFEFDNLS